jgi:hypothetical protein
VGWRKAGEGVTAEIESFIKGAAQKRGINGSIAIRVAKSEGGVNEYAARGTFATGSSWWPFQLHYGGPGYEYLGTVAGMGTGFTKLTGWQPGDPNAWRDSIRYALNRAKASGWGAWYGAAHVGVAQWEGIDRDAPWDANAETWDYEGGTSDLAYNPSQPPERQVQSWTCSIRATSWMLLSLGLPVDIGELQDEMTPRYVTPELGLLDGRGYGLAEVLRAHLPADWHDNVHVFERIDWDTLWKRSGTGPIGLGLHGAYHWINVAMPNADGTLSAPNPAPKYPQATPIGDTLTRAEFNAFGPVSAVWIDASPPVVEPDDPYYPWRATVGSGLLSMMEADETLPAQASSTWLPLGVHPSDIEECYGQNGTRYAWFLTNGTSWRYTPKGDA